MRKGCLALAVLGLASCKASIDPTTDPSRFQVAIDLVAPSGGSPAMDRLAIGTRATVDAWFEVPESAVLRVDRVARRGGTGPLRVTALRDQTPEQLVAEWDDGSTPAGVALEPGPVRLRFENPSDGAWVAVRPRIETPRSAVVSVSTAPTPIVTPSARQPNVVLYLIDTLRADHLGTYGYPRATSPAIDDFARSAVVFERAQAQTSWTRPAVASIFTGLEAWSHGANHRNEGLAEELDTLAERFQAAGFQTGAVITNPNVARSYGFAQGFGMFQRLAGGRNSSLHVAEAASAWFDSAVAATPTKPFFLYLHTVDPHAPYRPAPAFRERLAERVRRLEVGTLAFLRRLGVGREPVTAKILSDLVDLYDAEVAENDAGFGKLIDDLRRRHLLESTVIVLVSDHGEEFHEHGGFEHGSTLYQDQLHVPLIVRAPGFSSGRRTSAVVQQIDLFPTLLDLTGVATDVPGQSLRPLLVDVDGGDGKPFPEVRELVATMDVDQVVKSSLVRWPWKLVRHERGPQEGTRSLFDLSRDPTEQLDRAEERPFLADYLSARLAQRLSMPRTRRAEVPEDEELQKDLKALGYLQ